MNTIVPALFLLAMTCSAPTNAPQTSAAPSAEDGHEATHEATNETTEGSMQDSRTLAVREVAHELTDRATTVSLPIGNARGRALEIANDARRHLVLRIEGITANPGVNYDVSIEGASEPAGVLSFYGAEESNGAYVAGLPIDAPAAQVLRTGATELRVTFTPQGLLDENGRTVPVPLTAKARFARLRLVEE